MSSSPLSLLHVGASGMRAGQFGVNVTSQNLTNAATPGYSRRSVQQDPLQPPPDGGAGVWVRGSARTVDRFVERRLLGASSDRGEATARSELLGILDTTFADAQGNIGGALDAFHSSLQELTGNPGDRATRAQVLARASQLAASFRTTADALAGARREADTRIGDTVNSVNSLTSEIARIQTEMKRSEISGQEASDLRDQRDQRIRELSSIVPVSVVDGEDGAVNVLLAGRTALVDEDGHSYAIAARPDATTGRMVVTRRNAGVDEDVTSTLTSGSLGGYVNARDGALADAISNLDQLAFDLGNAYNAVQSAGVGLDGATGRNLFDVGATAQGAASRLALSADVAGNPDAIGAASTAAGVPGDNRQALSLSAVASSLSAASGTRTFVDELSRMVTDAGIAGQTAQDDADAADAVHAQVTSLRESVSGVNSDEEMTSLIRYQRAYEASLRVIQTADDMLDQLIAMKR